ncbi:MAG: helix-turn-helix transcriptional regulator [Clostridia bacterium]|nr:helix-turn-helix transcriptional regulator [Clostridia bacterium]
MSYYIISDLVHYCNVRVKQVEEMKLEVIDYYDLTFVLEGKMVYVIDGKEIVLNKNDVLFVKPNSQRTRYKTFEKSTYVSLNFRTDLTDIKLPVYMKNAVKPSVRKLLSFYPDSYLPDESSLKKCIYLYNYILLEMLESVNPKSENRHVEKMLGYINNNITKPITLTGLSEYTNLTKEYCSWIFKKEMGESPLNYINRQKMTVAKDLIQHNRMSLSDISDYLGFDNYNYFSRLFKKYHKMPPISFKR